MPSLEIKSLRSRKRTRSRLHLSSIPTSLADDSSPSTEKPSLHPLTTTGPSSSSSDERRGHKSPASSISSSSLFEDEQWKRVVRLRERDGLRDTVWWGYILLGTTWAVFVFGMGGVSGIWEWSLMPIRSEQSTVVRISIGYC